VTRNELKKENGIVEWTKASITMATGNEENNHPMLEQPSHVTTGVSLTSDGEYGRGLDGAGLCGGLACVLGGVLRECLLYGQCTCAVMVTGLVVWTGQRHVVFEPLDLRLSRVTREATLKRESGTQNC